MWFGFVWSTGDEPVCVCVCVCVCGLLDLITVIYENPLSRVFGNRDLFLRLRTFIFLVYSPLKLLISSFIWLAKLTVC